MHLQSSFTGCSHNDLDWLAEVTARVNARRNSMMTSSWEQCQQRFKCSQGQLFNLKLNAIETRVVALQCCDDGIEDCMDDAIIKFNYALFPCHPATKRIYLRFSIHPMPSGPMGSNLLPMLIGRWFITSPCCTWRIFCLEVWCLIFLECCVHAFSHLSYGINPCVNIFITDRIFIILQQLYVNPTASNV